MLLVPVFIPGQRMRATGKECTVVANRKQEKPRPTSQSAGSMKRCIAGWWKNRAEVFIEYATTVKWAKMSCLSLKGQNIHEALLKVLRCAKSLGGTKQPARIIDRCGVAKDKRIWPNNTVWHIVRPACHHRHNRGRYKMLFNSDDNGIRQTDGLSGRWE